MKLPRAGGNIRLLASVSWWRVAIVPLGFLVALLWVGDTISGHWAQPDTDSHFYAVKDVENGPWYSVTMWSNAATHEYRDGAVMVMDAHQNSLAVKNGRCGLVGGYPFCWGALNTPKTRYYHSSNSYTLTEWSDQDCWYEFDDHYKCWESFLELGWLTIPVTADAYRNVPIHIDDWPQYGYGIPPVICCSPSVTPHTHEYDVD